MASLMIGSYNFCQILIEYFSFNFTGETIVLALRYFTLFLGIYLTSFDKFK